MKIHKRLHPVIYLVSLFSVSVGASTLPDRTQLKPLFFQADKNNLQVLPQRFEYALVDEDRIRIGDILIDASQLNFQIIPGGAKGSYRLSFRWPAGLLTEGNVLIKDNGGKAIFSSSIDRKKVKIVAGTANEFSEGMRFENADYTSPEISPSLLDEMKFLPYMTFCVFREEEQTRIYLCSKDLYISTNKGVGPLLVKSRSAVNRQAQVEINGSKVGNQGIIFLNNAEENLILKAYSKSGAVLEIETRKNDVDFKDVVATEDGKELILTASGAAPVDPKKVKMIRKGEWQIHLPIERPFVFLKGDGDIPMRQEFLVKGPLPLEKNRPFLVRNAISRTYSSSLGVIGYLADGTTASSTDSESHFKMENSGRFQWELDEIRSGLKNRRYLTVQAEGHDFVAGYDVFRGKAFELGLAAKYLTPSAIAYGSFHFFWWIENFFALATPITHLRWGVELEQQQHLTTKSDEGKIDILNVDLLYRFASGFYHEDETWGFSLPVQRLSFATEGFDSTTMTLLGIGVFAQMRAPESLEKWMKWYNTKFNYFFSSSGTDFKTKSAYEWEWIAYKPYTESWFLNYGLSYTKYSFDPPATKEAGQVGLTIGTSYHF